MSPRSCAADASEVRVLLDGLQSNIVFFTLTPGIRAGFRVKAASAEFNTATTAAMTIGTVMTCCYCAGCEC